MAENKLTVRKIESLKTAAGWKRAGSPKYISDGGSLRFQLTPGPDGRMNINALYRCRNGREMGLGALTESFGLAEVRAERDRQREIDRSGRNPIEERDRRAAERKMED